MRTIALGTLALVAALTTTTGPAPAYAGSTVAPSCDGRPATIVGVRNQAVVGTPGDDVIVATTPSSVSAGAGADVICIQGSGGKVDLGDADDIALGHAPSHDTVTTTGGGITQVVSGYGDLPDDDSVQLGGWGDTLTLYGVPTGTFVASDISPGVESAVDLDQLVLVDPVAHQWQVDEAAGTVRTDGGAATTLAGWETLHLDHLAWSSFGFVGSPGEDTLRATGPSAGPGPITASLGAGPDEVLLSPTLTGTIEGGSGKDDASVRGTRHGQPTGDLLMPLTGTWTYDGKPGVALDGFEYGDAQSVRHAVLRGNGRPNTLSIRTCTGEVSGGGRSDQIFLAGIGRCSPQRNAFVARGGPGNDWFQGSGLAGDLIIGGPGSDYAEDEGHGDHCLVERPRC